MPAEESSPCLSTTLTVRVIKRKALVPTGRPGAPPLAPSECARHARRPHASLVLTAAAWPRGARPGGDTPGATAAHRQTEPGTPGLAAGGSVRL